MWYEASVPEDAYDALVLLALLSETGLVHDNHTALLRAYVLYDMPAQIIAPSVGIPASTIKDALSAPWRRFSDSLRPLTSRFLRRTSASIH